LKRAGLIAMVATAMVATFAMRAQGFDTDVKPEMQTVAAGKSAMLELHFKVLDGFHVNSHTPKSELLIPTKLSMEPAAGVKAAAVEYPAGQVYSFSFDPTDKLDVYSGAFTVKVPVVAAAGEHTISGALHYQACDHASCYPPKTLAVAVVFTAK
jgi:hypothetical protein